MVDETMSIPIITVLSDPNHPGFLRLKRSADKFGWVLIPIVCEWKGFGTKIIETYEYLKEHPDIESFVFCDAFDVVVLGTEEEFVDKLGGSKDKMLFNSEKGLWPPTLEPFRRKYRMYRGGFCYLNSGVYYSTSRLLIDLVEDTIPQYETDDQFYFNINYLLKGAEQKVSYGKSMILDVDQSIFNCHSFISENEYTYENGRIQIMGNEPIFIHSNGRTNDPKLEELLEGLGV